MIRLLLGITMGLLAGTTADAACPESHFIPIPKPGDGHDFGHYLRVHPSGNYVLISGYGEQDVVIVDLTKTPPKIISTPFNDETYPVEPNWQLIASPYNSDGMRYYEFEKVLALQDKKNVDWKREVPAAFHDRDHNEVYHSSAVVGGAKNGTLTVRTLLFHQQSYRDYQVDCSGPQCNLNAKSPQAHLCEPTMLAGDKRKRLQELREQVDQLNFETGEISSRIADNAIPLDKSKETMERLHEIMSTISQLSPELSTLNIEIYGNGSGYMNQPILSKDGTEVAGTVGIGNEHIVIQKINANGSCSTVERLPFMGGKVSFSHPIPGKNGMIAYSKSYHNDPNQPEHAYVYDRNKKEEVRISNDSESDARYPGFTKDGRVIYRAVINGVVGVRIVAVHDENGNRCSETEKDVTPTDQSLQ